MSRYINLTIKFLVHNTSENIICQQKYNYVPLRYRGKQGPIELTNYHKKIMDEYVVYFDDKLRDHEIIGAEIIDETLQNNSINAETMKQTFTEIMKMPLEIRKTIFEYIPPEVYTNNIAKLIKNISQVYDIDHDPDLTKQTRFYCIKNILTFSQYVFRTLYEDEYNGCIYGANTYDTLELSPYMKLAIKDNI